MNHSNDIFDVSRLISRNINNRRMTGVDNVLIGFINSYELKYSFYLRYKLLFIIFPYGISVLFFKKIKENKTILKTELFLYALACIPFLLFSLLSRSRNFYNLGHSGLDRSLSLKTTSLFSKKIIVLIHDLIPIRMPNFCIKGEDLRHVKRMKNIINFSDKIIFLSEITKKHFYEWADKEGLSFDINMTKVINPAPSLKLISNVEKKHFCMIGTIEPRKGYMDIIKLFNEEKVPPFPLIIIGQPGWMCDVETAKLKKLDSQKKLIWLDNCSDKELIQIMSSSKAIIQNSYAEGFGLPIMEAINNDTIALSRFSNEIEIFNHHNAIYYNDISELLFIIKNNAFEIDKNKNQITRNWSDVYLEFLNFVKI